jgi:aminoglycoside phosphotransferase (APT) family kinase protein
VNEHALRLWIEKESGGAVERLERIGPGASRATWAVGARVGHETRAWIARVDTGDGPVSGTELTLRREATVYGALRDTAVRIPRLVGTSRDGDVLLIERVGGSEEFAGVSDPGTRAQLARDYMLCLAELHRLEPADLDLPGFARPATGPEHALLDLELWRRIYSDRTDADDPLLQVAFAWLAAHPPAQASRTSLCHGDAGPGNFLFEGDRVTALLDWEFAHLGDPLDDLAWVAVRSHLVSELGVLPDTFATWSRATGCALDWPALEYYRALVLVRMAVSCAAALHFARTRPEVAMDTGVYTLLLPYLAYLIPQALAGAGCRDVGLAPLARDAELALGEHPIFSAVGRPLQPLEPA